MPRYKTNQQVEDAIKVSQCFGIAFDEDVKPCKICEARYRCAAVCRGEEVIPPILEHNYDSDKVFTELQKTGYFIYPLEKRIPGPVSRLIEEGLLRELLNTEKMELLGTSKLRVIKILEPTFIPTIRVDKVEEVHTHLETTKTKKKKTIDKSPASVFKTLQECENFAVSRGIDIDTIKDKYKDSRIYRMRLVMAIKSVYNDEEKP